MPRLAPLLLALGCGEPTRTPPDTGTATSAIPGRACPPDSPVTWDGFAGPLLRSWCTGCHSPALAEADRSGAPVGVDLVAHEDAAALSARIYAMAADDARSMPPVGGPPDADRWLLGDWLACGAP